ncbi:YrbL family protein [Halomonas sp. McH1-25]|uniref:YrbL family protein n=1 Tax=unclassified Halomonas TaxID=2609666 RepID=UPI001EF65A64|nr:YrbL family protein [Halomonas sp. McH1-25]MCP1340935.1 YrbL family protein [Halomonas sp. FL8]MCP1362506.1 YrbL family protein [Halomonas sp. BBD45]MCP1364732.1 YrbL family protein [Halomonas sp. BBD48]
MTRRKPAPHDMLYLDDTLLIGQGSERACFRHPSDDGLCIKVTHRHKSRRSQNARDHAYYRKLEKRDIAWTYLPRMHGWVTTNRGEGLVFDLVQDRDGKPLDTLKHLLARRDVHYADIAPELERFHRYLLDNLIFTSDMRDSNIACDMTRADSPRLYLIDGLGNHDFIKLASVVPILGRSKVERQWAHFMKRMAKWRDQTI